MTRPQKIVHIIWIFFAAFTLLAPKGYALTLKEAYESAREKSEPSQLTSVATERAEELKTQAYGSLFPSLRLSYRILTQDIPPTSGGSVPSAFREENQTTSSISLVQPLFRGGAEFATLKMANLTIENSRSLERAFDFELWVRVAEDFFGVLSLEKEYQIVKRLRSSLTDRVSELRRRARIGQTRRSDLLSAQAQAQATDSELLALESRIQASRRALAITASVPESQELSDDVNFPNEIPSLATYVDKVRSHPALEVARRDVQIAEQSKRVASAGHWPQLDLQGNYYIDRPGVLADSKWDVSLNLTLPLFQGGIVSSQVRDQVYARTQRELELALLEKEMDASLRNFHEEAVKAKEILEGARRSVELYRQSYNLLNQEYRNGIISYLEVNPVEREYWESLRRLQHQEAEFKLAWVRLQAIVGEHP